ncbi:MAG: lipocalin family protein [Bacteroidetes bacterium]|nr:lipocalin family protein [Bacteroidota bacterium]
MSKKNLQGTWKLISEDQCDLCDAFVPKENKFLTFYTNSTCEGILVSHEKTQSGQWELAGQKLTIIFNNEKDTVKYTAQFYDNKLYFSYQTYYGSANRIFILNNKN